MRFQDPCLTMLGILAVGAIGQTQQTEGPPRDYVQVWADEFDADGAPNPTELGLRGRLRAQSGTAVVSAGECASRERPAGDRSAPRAKANPRYDAGSPDWRRSREFAEYTSSSLMTRGQHSWQYGYFEMRARIDTRDRIVAGVVDARRLRRVAAQRRDRHHGVLPRHSSSRMPRGAARAAAAQSGTTCAKPSRPRLGADWASRFHVWRMLWDEQSIRVSVDDVWLNDIDLDTTANQDGSGRQPAAPAALHDRQPRHWRHAGRRSIGDGFPAQVRDRLCPGVPAKIVIHHEAPPSGLP